MRGFSGLLAGGLVALVLALGVAWVVAIREGAPGPGIVSIGWHGLAAVVAVVLQRYADRRRDARGMVAALAIVAITTAVLMLLWIA